LKPVRPDEFDVRTAPRRQLALAGLVLAVGMAINPAQATGGDAVSFASAIERGIVLVQEGVVSWYGAAFHDKPTASGERFDSEAMTMAHPTLPRTHVKVTNLRNGRTVVVRVNGRGRSSVPHCRPVTCRRAQLGMMKRGVARARIQYWKSLIADRN
jgi:rare lipoprotein A